MKFELPIFIIFLSLQGLAAEFTYPLRDLRSLGMSVKKGSIPGQTLFFLTFENSQGVQTIVYDQYSLGNENPDLEFLKTKTGSWDSKFSLDFRCKTKAYCMENCKKKYYEFSNGTSLGKSDPLPANLKPGTDRAVENNCALLGVDIERLNAVQGK